MTTFNASVFMSQIDALLQAEQSEIEFDDRRKMLAAALEQYSHDAPDEVTEDVTGDGGKYYPISGLASWSDEFSQVVRMEYPADAVSSDEDPQWLEPDDYDMNYRDASNVQYIYFPNHTPAATETVRITYTAPYTLSADAVDIPITHFQAVCYLAAALICDVIATRYARTSDSVITADSVDHGGRSARFRTQSKAFRSEYERTLGIGEFSAQADGPAGEFVDWDTAPTSWSSGQWLTHDRSRRY